MYKAVLFIVTVILHSGLTVGLELTFAKFLVSCKDFAVSSIRQFKISEF
jgi:hypothetical protein